MPEPMAPASMPMPRMISITGHVVAVDDDERGEARCSAGKSLHAGSSSGC